MSAQLGAGVPKATADDKKLTQSTLATVFKLNDAATSAADAESSKARKRKSDTDADETQPAKRSRSVSQPAKLVQPAVNNLQDSIREGLILISVGLNPGIMTGKTGHAYAHPTNRYWPTLHGAGITPVLHKPRETHDLMDLYGLGHTNIVAHIASKDGSSLTAKDYADGSKILEEKIRECTPQAVMLVGKGIFEEWFRYKKGRKFKPKTDKFEYGLQDASIWVGREPKGWEGARTYVVTTTSGLSTSHNQEQRVAIWKPVGDWFAPKREQWVAEQVARETAQS